MPKTHEFIIGDITAYVAVTMVMSTMMGWLKRDVTMKAPVTIASRMNAYLTMSVATKIVIHRDGFLVMARTFRYCP